MKQYYSIIFFTIAILSFGCGNNPGKQQAASEQIDTTAKWDKLSSEHFLTLPEGYNTPDGLAMAPDGNLILSVPNFNNEHLMEKGRINEPSAPFMAIIDKDNNISRWYEYKPEDMHPETGKAGPMDAAFGPDGNLYVADMQVFFDDAHKSRVLRINVENGKPVSADVVVTGFIASNGTFWEDSVLYVTESVLQKKEDTLISGVYAFTLDELTRNAPVELTPYKNGRGDEHLVESFISDNHMGFGADGVTFDDEGYLYTTVIEKGEIYRSFVDVNHKAVETTLFAKDENMTAPDGLIYSPEYDMFFVADFLNNAVHAIRKNGEVITLQKNGDVTGANGKLDQPAEVILRDDELVVVNMDMAWASEGLSVNTKVDTAFNLAVINLPDK